MAASPRVFISYAHEIHDPQLAGHRARALDLAQWLRSLGIDARIDQFVEHEPPYWPRWTLDEIRRADFVLCLASPTYRSRFEDDAAGPVGHGAAWEGAHITELLYQAKGDGLRKFVNVVLPGCTLDHIPDVLRPVGAMHYLLPAQNKELYGRLTRQPRPRAVPRELGTIVRLDAQEFDGFYPPTPGATDGKTADSA